MKKRREFLKECETCGDSILATSQNRKTCNSCKAKRQRAYQINYKNELQKRNSLLAKDK